MICKILEAMAKQYKPKNLVFHNAYWVGVANSYVFHYKDINNISRYIGLSKDILDTMTLSKLVPWFELSLNHLNVSVEKELQNV